MGVSRYRPAVGFGRSSHTRLQQPASRSASGRVLSPPYAAARPNARSTGGAWSAWRHARPAAHTLRAVVRSAAVTRSSAPVQVHQRSAGGQRLAAAATQQPLHATGIRLPAAPPAADAQQRPPEAVPEPRQPLLRPPNSPSSTESACGLLAAHPMPHATPDAAAPEDRLPRRTTPPQPLQLLLQSSTESEASPMAMPTTIDGRAAIQSSLVRAWGLEGYARIQRTVRETDVSAPTPTSSGSTTASTACAGTRSGSRATTRSWRGRRPPPPWRSRTCCAR